MKHVRALITIGLLLMAATSSLTAQDGVTYEQEVRIDIEGLGVVGDLLAKKAFKTKVYNTPMFQNSETRNDWSITDLEAEELIIVNHKDKTYYKQSFEEMAEMMNNLAAEAEDAGDAEQDDEDMELDYEYSFDIQKTGLKEKINGVNTEQTLLIARFDVEANDEEEVEEGTIYVVSDMRLGGKTDGWEVVQQFQQNWAEKMGGAMTRQGGFTAALAEIFKEDPRMSVANQRMLEEMSKIDGLPIQTNMHFVAAPYLDELDMDKVMPKKKKKKRLGLGGLAKAAMKQAGLDDGEDSDVNSREITEQKTIFSFITDMKKMKRELDMDKFKVPEGYRESVAPNPFEN